MRLIYADRLLADLKEENVVPIYIQNLTKKNKQIIRFENMIYEQPTAYDVDKVVENLEELRDRFNKKNFAIRGIIEKAIEIVKEGYVDKQTNK